MNYQAHYNKLIERAQNRLLEGYCEQHHIVPRCMGGVDEADNLVRLTAEEHYVAHQLLVKMNPGHKGLIYAARMMTTDSNGGRVNNKLYGWLKRRYSIARTGFKHTAEARAKISAAQIGTKHSAATKAKMSASAMGIRPSAEARAKMSKAKENYVPWNAGMKTGIVTAGAFKKGNTPWNVGKPAYTKALEINGVTYNSRREAAKMLKKDETTIIRWLANGKAIDLGITS